MAQVDAVEQVADREWMYDLSVPGNESFLLSRSEIFAHNSYSIGGVSLDLEKSSKYQSMADTLHSRLEAMIENAHRTIKITKGLRQSKYGLGARSSFGPYVGRGYATPHNFSRF
tara:strand:- start:10660 stop:11001 length:342 start_codon:yes stop_codon:yes gene_type:complete